MKKEDIEQLMIAVAQAAVEAKMQLHRTPLLHEMIFTVRTEIGGIALVIDRNHRVEICKKDFSREGGAA